jgi:voltage-gated potassium channel Kch
MNQIFSSPLRNLLWTALYLLGLTLVAVLAYMGAGWSLGDALYMVVLTIYSVGYREVHPVDTDYLRAVTMGVIVFGCTGMILASSVLVQVLTFSQIQKFFGANRMKNEMRRLDRHVIICGFGRIGSMLAEELKAGGAPFVIVDRDQARLARARELGYLCIAEDATDEDALLEAGIDRAQALATVLPDDAANVFITLSARSLNPDLSIIARGEAPSTESKLRQAGADRVVLPAHIGAERIAELILFTRKGETDGDAAGLSEPDSVQRHLARRGLAQDFFVVSAGCAADGATVRGLEGRFPANGFIVQVDRAGSDRRADPAPDLVLRPGDGVTVVARQTGEISRLFTV